MHAHANHFAKQCMDEIRSGLAPQLAMARGKHGAGFMLTTLNETMIQWWHKTEKRLSDTKLSEAQHALLQREFVDGLKDHIGAVVADELINGALMYVYFQGFVQNHALPAQRAEAVLDVPTQADTPPQTIAVERLTGANVVPFLRGRLFESLGSTGFSVRADLYTLMALVDELLQQPTPPAAIQHINIEPASLIDAHFYTQMQDQLHRLPKPYCARVCLEITERGRARLVADKLRHLSRMREVLGIQLAYDDYMGHPWEDEQLDILQPSSVKIDGHLIKTQLVELEHNAAAYAENLAGIASMLDKLAVHAPRARLVAEWTESPKVYKDLALLGVDEVQSYVLNAKLSRDKNLLNLTTAELATRSAAQARLNSLRSAGKA